MRVLVITSCTGEKAVHHERALKLEDFKQGAAHVAQREAELAHLLTPAEELYTGQQHVRLMRGVKQFRERTAGSEHTLDLWVLSAGYGLVPATKRLAPYEATFNGMLKPQLQQWAQMLEIPEQIRLVLCQPYDLGLILLGDAYLQACALDDRVKLGGPTVLFCGKGMAQKLPELPGARVVTLTNPDARRFSCPLIALKGELAARLLEQLPGGDLIRRIQLGQDPLEGLKVNVETESESASKPKVAPRINPAVDKVIAVPTDWWEKPHRAKLRYFIPEWDDLVDPEYDFMTDTHSGGSGDWTNEVYAHQMYPEPSYDGILMSKVIAFKTKKKEQRIKNLGVHRFLRVPEEFPIMGDCGAFGYIHEEVPPYTTREILDYYTELGFDYGVSIDHLIVTATEEQKQYRYELTLHNAEEFLREHKKRGLTWEPIGAVQGWDPKSYASAARQCVAMGYRYIGLGGLVRTSTPEVLRILEEVHKVVPEHVAIHLFGLARLNALQAFADLGVRSVDSASLLRRAWMGTGQNYLTSTGELYAAIRIPEVGKSFRAKRMVSEGRISAFHAERLERQALEAMLAYDQGMMPISSVVEIITELDRLITPDRPDNSELLRRTLEAAPWKSCPCDICRRDGVQVIIFRGNNRNRRRGFHNTYVFYRLVQRVLAGEQVCIHRARGKGEIQQLSLFESWAETE